MGQFLDIFRAIFAENLKNRKPDTHFLNVLYSASLFAASNDLSSAHPAGPPPMIAMEGFDMLFFSECD